MAQFSTNSTTTTTIPSSSPPPFIPLFLDSLPFLSPSSLLSSDPSQQVLPPPPPPRSPAPARSSKKRARASRRAPTTVLTTDTSNFRAMVQEFTGIPSPPFSSSSLPPRSPLPFPPPFLSLNPKHKHQTFTTPNTFLQSLINTPSPTAFSTSGREELQHSFQTATMLDSWICSSDYK